MVERKRFLKDVGAVGTSVYVTRFLYMVRGLICARFLGPGDYGIWGSLGILLGYSNAAALGTAEALGREIPYSTQRGEHDRVTKTKEQSFSFNAFTSLLLTLAVVLYALTHRHTLQPIYFEGLLVVAAGLILQQLYFFYGVLFRAEKRFFLKSKVEIGLSVINVSLTVTLVILYGLRGLFAGFLLSYFLVGVFLLRRFTIPLRFSLDRRFIFELIQIGFPNYLIGLVYTLFASVDRLVIVKYLPTEDMGYYAIGLTLLTMIGEAPVVLSQVVGPNLVERYGKSSSPSELARYVEIPSMAIAFFFPALLGVALFGYELLVTYFLPKFMPGLRAVEILVLGSYFLGVARGPSSFLFAIRRLGFAVAIYAVCVVVAAALNIGAVKAGLGLAGVAAATGATFAILFILYSAYVLSFIYEREARHYVRFFVSVFLSFTYSTAMFFALKLFLPLSGEALAADIGRILLRCLLFVAVLAPGGYYMLRRYGLWEGLLGTLLGIASRLRRRR